MTNSGTLQDSLYREVIEQRELKSLKPNFLVMAQAPDGHTVTFDAATRLMAMNQVLFYENKMHYTNVFIYRLKEGQYVYDNESQELAYQPRNKSGKPVEKPKVNGVNKQQAKSALRTFETQVHSFMVQANFTPEVRKEFVEYIVTAYCETGGTAEELIAEVENTITNLASTMAEE